MRRKKMIPIGEITWRDPGGRFGARPSGKANAPLGSVIIDETNTVIVGHSIIGTAIADGVKNVMVIDTEDLYRKL